LGQVVVADDLWQEIGHHSFLPLNGKRLSLHDQQNPNQ